MIIARSALTTLPVWQDKVGSYMIFISKLFVLTSFLYPRTFVRSPGGVRITMSFLRWPSKRAIVYTRVTLQGAKKNSSRKASTFRQVTTKRTCERGGGAAIVTVYVYIYIHIIHGVVESV